MIAAECCFGVMAGCIGSLDYPAGAMRSWELETERMAKQNLEDRYTLVDAYCR
jgi:hypothetical protein